MISLTTLQSSFASIYILSVGVFVDATECFINYPMGRINALFIFQSLGLSLVR